MSPVDVCDVWTVDRVEEAVAVVEDCHARVADVPVFLLPPGIAEGDRVLVRRVPLVNPSGERRRRLRVVRSGPESPVQVGSWTPPSPPNPGPEARTE